MSDRDAACLPGAAAWRVRAQAVFWFVLAGAFVLGLPAVLGWGYALPLALVAIAALLALPSVWLAPRRFTDCHSCRGTYPTRWRTSP